jgi:hypothetical protein
VLRNQIFENQKRLGWTGGQIDEIFCGRLIFTNLKHGGSSQRISFQRKNNSVAGCSSDVQSVATCNTLKIQKSTEEKDGHVTLFENVNAKQ